MAKTRIYIATPLRRIDADSKARLVDAGTGAQARQHVTRGLFEIRPATTKEVAELVGAGVKVETVSADTETPTLPGVDE